MFEALPSIFTLPLTSVRHVPVTCTSVVVRMLMLTAVLQVIRLVAVDTLVHIRLDAPGYRVR